MYEFVVIGSGITGLSTSIKLRSYNYNVLLVGVKESASIYSAGIMTLQLESLRDILLVKESIKILKEIIEDAELEEAGIVSRGFISIEDSREAVESAELLRKADVKFKQFDVREASEIWSQLNFNEGEVITFTEDDVLVEPNSFINFLIRHAEERGVEIRVDKVERIEFDRGCRLVLGSSEKISSDIVILCMGAWTKDFLSKIDIMIPTTILRCPAFRFKVEDSIPPFADEVYESYWRPGINKTVVGGGYHAEIVNDSRMFFGEPLKRFRSGAEKLLRLRIKGRVEFVEGWSGPCSVTPDLEPIIDSLPRYENIYFIDGLRGYGLMRGLALGYLLADIASGKKSIDSVEDYRLSRFFKLF
ncbi:MAG: FAD-binding oxidoreductase [Aigarchaeota archaeon]|nr:FAD-binding oxidoreductase [Aigarchaeota archaeon]MCX8192241.1 FAD-binding oxidoreductase [Nitrososphaeria archaeon]MDW7986151.1 FAD-binding oxidoreductase [Nitrososphaerota archaeon]